MTRPQFTAEQIAVARRTIETVAQARDVYPYADSATPDDIRGHTVTRGDVTLSYKVVE